MSETKPKVIAFLSGKGGSGKTTAAIAIAKLLADMGFKTLLIDFDLATNGASYFFKSQFPRTSKGIWEYLAAEDEPFNLIVELPIQVADNLLFVASRTNLNKKGLSYDTVMYDNEWLQKHVLKPLYDYAIAENIVYVLIDCQAGYAISSAAAAEVSERAIVVTEADAISSDAAENLLIQMGQSLPDERRYLVNKIDVRDAETYRNMRHVFQAMNRLPPLPFDFYVRNAFGARQIPVDINKPSPLLFALFETLRYAFPEINDVLDTYKEKHIKGLFSDYDSKLQDLLNRKEEYERERLILGRQSEISGYTNKALYLKFMTGAIAASAAAGLYINFQNTKTSYFIGICFAGIILWVVGVVWSALRMMPSNRDNDNYAGEISHKIDSINEELAQIRSLLWTRSKEYLIEAELSKPRELVSTK